MQRRPLALDMFRSMFTRATDVLVRYRRQLEWVVQRHAEVVTPVADDLPRSWCHADGNEDNILVGGVDESCMLHE